MAQVANQSRKDLKQWVRNVEEHIITISGPALAASGIIAGLDVVTNNFIAHNAPGVGAFMGLVWAVCLMLTLDFQVLVLGVRARRVYVSNKGNGQKAFEMALAFSIALALGYVSLQMGSIFARMMGTSLTMEQAQAQLGINPIALVYERSAMVMLLIFMSGWLRDESAQEDEPPAASALSSISDADMNLLLAKLAEAIKPQIVVSEHPQEQQALLEPAQELSGTDTGTDEGTVGTDERIEAAYRELQASGPVTVAALAQSAHVRKATASEWLRKQREGKEC